MHVTHLFSSHNALLYCVKASIALICTFFSIEFFVLFFPTLVLVGLCIIILSNRYGMCIEFDRLFVQRPSCCCPLIMLIIMPRHLVCSQSDSQLILFPFIEIPIGQKCEKREENNCVPTNHVRIRYWCSRTAHDDSRLLSCARQCRRREWL